MTDPADDVDVGGNRPAMRTLGVSVVRAPGKLAETLCAELAACWVDTTNAGGAVGFPFPPVDLDEVRPVVGELSRDVAAGRSVLLVARRADRLVGWVSLDLNAFPLVAHGRRSAGCSRTPTNVDAVSGQH